MKREITKIAYVVWRLDENEAVDVEVVQVQQRGGLWQRAREAVQEHALVA
jgi:hypothetical protein